MNRTTMLIALLAVLILGANRGYAEQPPSPCHPNPNADQDMAAVAERGDIASLPAPLESQILRIAGRPHSQLPTQAFNEADGASQLFQYYLLDANGFEPNVFTRFADMAQEAATSRVVAGVAFPSDVFSGLDLGQNVGNSSAWTGTMDSSSRRFICGPTSHRELSRKYDLFPTRRVSSRSFVMSSAVMATKTCRERSR